MPRFLALLLLTVGLLISMPAWADISSRLGMVLNAKVSGKAQPTIELNPTEGVRSITVALKSKDGRSQTLRAQNIGAGSKRKLAIQQPIGESSYEGHFKVTWSSGEQSDFKIAFKMARFNKLRLSLNPQDVDLDARSLSFTINNPAARAQLRLVGPGGKQVGLARQEFNGASAGSKLTLTWRDPGVDVLYMELRVDDAAGFWTGLKLEPFAVEIPHEDLVFDNGKWDIRRTEEPKLEATYELIHEALNKHGKLIQLKLFIAGYTDTVGSTGDNQRLSDNRARSIARWFRRKGLKVPISYQGFGEKVLAKQTPDNTPEPTNRRAVYVLASQQPAVSETLPKQNWVRLP